MSDTETTEVVAKTLTPADTLGEGFGDMSEATSAVIEQVVQGEIVDLSAESGPLDPPNALNYVGSSATKPWQVQLWKGLCLDCDALIPGADVEGLKQKCHYQNGNQHCPAKDMTFVFIGLKIQLVNKFNIAKKSGDPAKVSLAIQKIMECEDEATRISILKDIGMLG